MKYLKIFENESNYTSYKNSEDYITPNVSMIKAIGGVRMKAYVPPPVSVGDVAYWNGSSVKTTPHSKWNPSLGTPIGVVVVPEGFAPDGKPRIVSLLYVDASGNTSTSSYTMEWNNGYVDTSLTNFDRVPTTDNNGSTSTGSNSYGYLPSDIFTGATSFVDPKAEYKDTSNLIPSPYLGDIPNPEYYKEILSGSTNINALSDFNGLSNTKTLVDLGVDYVAANACWKYNDGASNLQWYLPAIGELGYLASRLKEINNVIKALGGADTGRGYLWSSSESSRRNAYRLDYFYCRVFYSWKSDAGDVRPFAIL